MKVNHRGWKIAALLALTGAIGALVAFRAGGPVAPVNAPTAEPFRIATYNILYHNRNVPAVAANIRRSRADVACLQEVNDAAAKIRREELGGLYPHQTFLRGAGAGGAAILSKAPLHNVKVLPNPHGGFETQMCHVVLSGKTVQLVNVHLTATTPITVRSPLRLLRLFRATEAVRRKEIRAICDALPTDVAVVLAGDLNSLPNFGASRILRERGLVESLASVRTDHAKVKTWLWRLGPMSLGLRLDYIFHSPAVRTLTCRALDSDASDHALLVSNMRWTKETIRRSAGGSR